MEREGKNIVTRRAISMMTTKGKTAFEILSRERFAMLVIT